jgi:transcriptional regulator with XRE-family HTH domain
MTQADLARKASVTPSYVSRLEGAKVAPGIDMIERLAVVLGVLPADLLPTDDSPDPLPILKDQAKEMLATLLERGDREAFFRLNPFLALLVEAATKRR